MTSLVPPILTVVSLSTISHLSSTTSEPRRVKYFSDIPNASPLPFQWLHGSLSSLGRSLFNYAWALQLMPSAEHLWMSCIWQKQNFGINTRLTFLMEIGVLYFKQGGLPCRAFPSLCARFRLIAFWENSVGLHGTRRGSVDDPPVLSKACLSAEYGWGGPLTHLLPQVWYPKQHCY